MCQFKAPYLFVVLMLLSMFMVGCTGNYANTAAGSVEVPQDTATGSNLVVDNSSDISGQPCTVAPNDCSLRSAIEHANRDGRASTVTFDDHYYIELGSQLELHEAHTTLRANSDQDVYIDGLNRNQSVLRIISDNIVVDGLILFGSNQQPVVAISGSAHSVTLSNNVIGDDDAPEQRCNPNSAYAGVHVDANGELPEGVTTRAFIVGNIIECNAGHGISVATSGVVIGELSGGQFSPNTLNVIRHNGQYGVELGDTIGNVVHNNRFYGNRGAEQVHGRHENNIFDNFFTAD